jgi:hypothetical protein
MLYGFRCGIRVAAFFISFANRNGRKEGLTFSLSDCPKQERALRIFSALTFHFSIVNYQLSIIN